MKAKKKRITVCCMTSLILLVLLSAVCFFQFTAIGYRISVPHRSAFVKAADYIYVNKNYSGNIEDALQLTEKAMDRVGAFFGEIQCTDTTILILCDDEKLLAKLGGDHDTMTSVFPAKKNCISVSAAYCNIDILAHELTHAELHTRLTAKALKKIPVWFDEGLATQNDYREQYGSAAWMEQTENGKHTIAPEDMDTPSEFNAGTKEDRRFRYLNAKHEVREWMDIHQQQGLLELLDQLNSGAAFASAYSE